MNSLWIGCGNELSGERRTPDDCVMNPYYAKTLIGRGQLIYRTMTQGIGTVIAQQAPHKALQFLCHLPDL